MLETDAAGLPAPAAASARARTGPTLSRRLTRPNGPSLEFLVRKPSGASGGAPVLFVHGAFTGAWCWEESWLRAIGESGRHAAAISLRGHGESEGRDALPWTGLPDFAEDLILAIGAMPAPPILVAHSIGGLLAQHLLAPALLGQIALRGLVLVGSLPPEGLALIGPSLCVSIWADACAAVFGVRNARAARYEDALFGVGIDAAGVAAYAARMGLDSFLALSMGSFTSLAQAYIPLPVVTASALGLPALVLNGSDDRLVDPLTARRTALYHGADYESLSGAGHCPMLGPQGPAGAQALIRWLDAKGL